MAKKQETVQDKIISQPASKIYFLKNSEGKFFNSKDDVYYSEMINANYEKDLSKMREVLKMSKFQDCEIHQSTDHELWEQMATHTTDLVLVGTYFQNLLFRVACRMPTISQVNKNMYQKLKVAIDCLKPFSSWNDGFIEAKEDQTDEVAGHMMEFFHELSGIKIHECAEVTEILKCYKADRKSILGVTTKVRKHNKEIKEKSF